MAWTTPKTDWADGNLVSASQLNELGANLDILHRRAFVQVHNSGNTSIPNSSAQVISFGTIRYRTLTSMFSTTTSSRLIAPFDGLYMIQATARWVNAASNDAGHRWISVKNQSGTSFITNYLSNPSDYNDTMELNVLRLLSQNDYIELEVSQNSGAALNINNVVFSIVYLGDFVHVP